MLHRVKKANDYHEGKYNGLGGKLEPGESPEECAIRETREESGLELVDPILKGFITFPNFDGVDDWVDRTFDTIKNLGPDQPVVITDVRFDNEARRLRTFGGRLVRIRRQTDNHDAVLGHRSETESAKLNSDHYLPNDGSITELHRRLNRLVDRLDKQRRPA